MKTKKDNPAHLLSLVLTCEHAGNRIPKEYAALFKEKQLQLSSHEGWDIGAYSLAKVIQQKTNAPFFSSQTSRLLVDLNRSIGNPTLFSEVIKPLSLSEKKKILGTYYHPYRQSVSDEINRLIQSKRMVLHLSIHSFTPRLNGKTRQCEIGLLFDPTSRNEKKFAEIWKKTLIEGNDSYRIKYNYPYSGTEDGLTTFLRSKYSPEKYLGLELEINQKLLGPSGNKSALLSIQRLEKSIATSIQLAQKLLIASQL
jgi:predicted N-formylglutamate amidohydrolase